MQESSTCLMILDEGQEKCARDDVLIIGEERFGPASDEVRAQRDAISDLKRLKRMVRRAVKANHWQEVLDTP